MVVVEDVAAIVEPLRIIGIEPHGFVGVRQRLIQIAGGAVGVGAFAEGARVRRVERDGAVEIGKCRLRLVDVPVGLTTIDQCVGERFRLVFQRIDQRAAGSDALLRRIGGIVGAGTDRGIGVALCMSRCPGESAGGKNGG